jgi:hypothetical protein
MLCRLVWVILVDIAVAVSIQQKWLVRTEKRHLKQASHRHDRVRVQRGGRAVRAQEGGAAS